MSLSCKEDPPFPFSSSSSIKNTQIVKPVIEEEEEEDDRWSKMLPDLLTDIIKRVESDNEKWPNRKSVVFCACVCKKWREVALEVVKPPVETGRITFPIHLKQVGPRELPMQCFIKRNRKNSTFYLYLCLTRTFVDKGKFLLAAKRTRHGGHLEYIISSDADDLSQRSNAYVGKLRADFLGTKFTIYDSQPPHNGAKSSSGKASRRFACKQISPQGSSGNFQIGHFSYKFNLLKSRGPRRMNCSLQCQPQPKSSTNDFNSNAPQCQTEHKPSLKDFKSKEKSDITESTNMILKNKAPRWHEHLQCWCLNFHGRVTVASVKNFQLVASVDPSQEGSVGDEEVVLLQFGKVGDDLFTMDYRQPLSAFQAFAICLTSFGTKFACE